MAIIDVVKFEGPPDVFAWRYPNQELGTWTQLIVHESQEAILYKGGQALDSFSAGRHTLSTANIPILSNITNLPFGGKSPFTAEVWFINKMRSLDVKWGTSAPIQLQDPKYNIIVSVRAFGQFGVQISDPRKFLGKMVGTLPTFDQSTLVKYYRGVLMSNIKDIISSYIIFKKISVVEISAYMTEISKHIMEAIAPSFDEMGITLLNFFVDSINIPEDDPAALRIKEALAKKAEMDIIGYTYHQERTFDTLEGAAKNPGSPAGAIGSGLGIGIGMAGPVYETMTRLLRDTEVQTADGPGLKPRACTECGTLMDEHSRFCSGCGQPAHVQKPDKPARDILCTDCGHVIPRHAKFCLNCGDPYRACPSCGYDYPADAKVCAECGAQLPIPCRECSHLLDPGAKFCPNCGASHKLQCTNCNHEVKPGQKFCMECGHRLMESESGDPS
ncbi:SPFH domain-containing protein [Paenibacillus ihbetae]|uniref:Antifreeze protein type I n=1 Tax=Paenibacillus ihbetae TaxID=1870820 RepID=A0ABX3JN80_9BACL|nr:SPFH domain-containing protein [Paenibacillus ihbetae]OOC58289.1 antifreeze protein type I [Paenibacillus ihbetae]